MDDTILKDNECRNIEKLVDEILLRNKDKLDKLNLKKTSDVYCLKNKNTIYYLKKKIGKPAEKTDSGILSEKIITEARENLGEEPLRVKKDYNKDNNNLQKNHKKKKIKFHVGLKDKKNTRLEPKKDEYNKVFIENKNYIKDEHLIEKRITEEPIKKSVSDSLNDTLIKNNIPQKNDFPLKNDLEGNKDFIKNENFEENKITEEKIKKPESENLNVASIKNNLPQKNGLEENKKFFKRNKEPKIKNDKPIDKTKDYKGIFGASKEKKSLFKRKEKTNNLMNKSLADERVYIKPYFRVENLPQRNNQEKGDALLLDNKIQETLEKNNDIQTSNEIEEKAIKLAEKHIKERETKIIKNDAQINQTNKLNSQKLNEQNLDAQILTKGDNDEEHVFFDEENSSFNGWSPQVTDKEKKDISQHIKTPRGEIPQENLQDVGEIELPKEVLQSKSVKLTDLGFSENEWEELDFYPLHEPFAYVEILRERESLDKCYFLVEVGLTEDEENLLAFIRDTMSKVLIDTYELEEKGDDNYLLEKLDQVIIEYDIKINDEQRKKIYYYIGKVSLGLGKIDPLMKDPNIEDISCDGANVPLFLYHRKYGSLKSNIKFNDEDELSSFVHKLAQKCGKHISIAEPMLDATMPDGSRIQMTLSDEITAKGSTFTIRKFRDDPFSPPDLVEFNTMSSEMIAYMWIAVENGINTLFAGGTASGKTTALNALSLFIPRESKIVSIEETREINLPHPNWIPGVARSGFGEVVADRMIGEIDMYDLMKAALRQRPEYIIVGEIRGREAYVLFQAMATGHATYSTVHADSAQSLIHRLEGKPINIPRVMLQSLDIVCLHVITRVKNIRARRCKQIIEIIDIDPTTKEILTNEVFRWDPVEDKFIFSGKSYILERIRAEKDMSRDKMADEIKNRMQIIEWMNKSNLREFKDVAKLVSQYSEAPQDTLKMIGRDAKK